MIELNSNTIQAKRFIKMYNASNTDDIFKAYKKPSSTKVKAFIDIKDEMNRAGGYGIRITGAGSDYFSVAYKLEGYLYYYTYLNVYKIKL